MRMTAEIQKEVGDILLKASGVYPFKFGYLFENFFHDEQENFKRALF